MDGTVIVADDDRTIRTVLSQALTRAGCRVRSTGTISTLWRWIEEGEGDVIVTDVNMPDGDALDILPAIRKRRPDLPIVVMSAQNTVMTAIRATEAGAYEYLPKPFDLKDFLATVNKALSQHAQQADKPKSKDEAMPLIGRSPAMQEVYRIMARLMNTDLGVMITGASGTGKELVARALHDFGQRKEGPFVALNMATIPADMIEVELFGSENQTLGMDATVIGKFEQADSGTLFLDEVGDMPLEAQSRLLRVLQEGEFSRAGGREILTANVRIIAATHQDLRALINEGKFREDLFYRLNVVPIRLPSAGARRGHCRSHAPFLAAGRRRRAAKQSGIQGRHRNSESAAMDRKRARAGKPDPPSCRSLSGRYHQRQDRFTRNCRATEFRRGAVACRLGKSVEFA